MSRAWFRVLAVGVAAASASACSSHVAPLVRASPPSAAERSAAKSDAVDPVLEARLAEYLRLHDWRSTSFAVGTPPGEPVVRPSRGITKQAKPPRPAQVRAYVWNRESCAVQSAFGMPFEADGSLCEGVVGGSALLDEKERDVVVNLVLAADAELVEKKTRSIVMCDFNPHHAFVFFDEHGTPVARVEPCFECGQFLWEPSSRPELLGRWQPPLMTDEERSTLAAIFDRHALGAWAFDPRSEELKRVRAYEQAVYGQSPLTPRGVARRSARLALPPPIDRDVAPKRARKKDRQRLCAWFQDQLETNGERMKSSYYECTSGVRYGFTLEEGDCEKSIAHCDVPAERIEDCLRAFARGPEPICAAGFPAECAGLRECVPGLREFSPVPAAAPAR